MSTHDGTDVHDKPWLPTPQSNPGGSGAASEPRWQTGTPDVAVGKQEPFWCAVDGRKQGRFLFYGNRHRMPLSDDCHDVPAIAVPVDGDEGDYEWTGWWEESCEQCETCWAFSGEVVAWMRLPNPGELKP